MLDALGESCMAMLSDRGSTPSSPPIENKPCFGLRRHRMEHRIHAVLFGCTARLRQIKGPLKKIRLTTAFFLKVL